jgi:hypothetical protein
VVQKVIGDGALVRFGSYLAGQQWLAALQDQAAREEITLSNALERIQEQQAMKFLIDLSPEQGALFIENGSITGIYTDNDFLHNEQWIREHFIAVQPSPTINAIGMKLVEDRPGSIIPV